MHSKRISYLILDKSSDIESMPYTEKPEVFGLHENANITFQSQETDRFLSTVLQIQPRLIDTGSGNESSVDKVVDELAQQILSNLPANLSQSEGLADLFTLDILYHCCSLLNYLRQ